MQCHSPALRLIHQEPCRTRRIKHTVVRDKQPSHHSLTQIWFKPLYVTRIQDFNRDPLPAVICVLPQNFRHLLFISCHPNGAALLVLNIFGKFGPQLLPERLRIASKRELRIGVVHNHDVSHAGGSCTASDDILIDDSNAQSRLRAFVRACSADDACAYDYNVVYLCAHAGMPLQNGSRGSSTSSASEFTKADPVMLG